MRFHLSIFILDTSIYFELILACWDSIILFIRDKKKDLAPNHAAYNPFGVDVFLSQRKIDHIARFVGLPNVSSYGELPPILVVNCQVLPISTFA